MAVCAVKVLGERNSGTHFVEWVIKNNTTLELLPNARGTLAEYSNLIPGKLTNLRYRTPVKRAIADEAHRRDLHVNGGWKHAAATPELLEFAGRGSIFLLFVVRHPVSWSQSFHRNPFHANQPVLRDYSAFLRCPWVTNARDELRKPILDSPLDLLALKYESYVRATQSYEHSAIIRYEDLLLDPAETLERLGFSAHLSGREPKLPGTSARSVGKKQLDLAGYIAKARSTSFHDLSDADRSFLLDRLSGCGIFENYAE